MKAKTAHHDRRDPMPRQSRASSLIIQCRISGQYCNVSGCHAEDGDRICRQGHQHGHWYNRRSGQEVPPPENPHRKL